jgi:glycosyltransferase involved in cell wall biosynthesis
VSSGKPDLSVVIPVSERFDPVRELYEAYRDGLRSGGARPEFIYVLDGAYDEVFAELRALQAAGEPIHVVQLARWFGEATALTIGAEQASSERLLFLPAYHQVDPAAVARLLHDSDADLVIARRWPRRDSKLNRVGTILFHRLLRAITGYTFRDIGCGVRLMKRRVFDEVTIYGDQHRFLPILTAHRGFTVAEVDLPQAEKDPRLRLYRPGTYVRRLLDLVAVFFIVRFTKKPLRFFGLLGSAMVMIGALILAVVSIQRVFGDMPLADRPALLLGALFLLLGVQLFALGLIGELIIFTHARTLKEYAVAERINFSMHSGRTDETSDARAQQISPSS